MSVDFRQISMLMPELASLSVHADLCAIEGTTVLRLEDLVGSELLFSQLVDLSKLLLSMRELATSSVLTEASIGPVFADVSLVFSICVDLGN